MAREHRGRIEGRLAERIPRLSSTFSQRPGLTVVSGGLGVSWD